MEANNLLENTTKYNNQETEINNTKNTILFGLGPHAKRIYFNLLKENNILLHILRSEERRVGKECM